MEIEPGNISDEKASALYQAYGLCIDDKPATFQPYIVSTGKPSSIKIQIDLDKEILVGGRVVISIYGWLKD